MRGKSSKKFDRKGVKIMLHITKNEYENEKTEYINPLVAGMAGIVVGAASVSILLLSDREIRKKVLKRAHELKINLQEWSNDKIGNFDIDEEVLEESGENLSLRATEEDMQKREKN